MTEHRYPVEALAQTMCLTIHTALAQLGVSGTTQQRYRADGVTRTVAERLANQAGYHPATIWPEIIDHDIADLTRRCEECGEPFVPNNDRHRFCNRNCSSRRWQRQRYSQDPEFRETERARRRQRYEDCGDYERAAQKRRSRTRTQTTQHQGAA